jgi:hypothetical protein
MAMEANHAMSRAKMTLPASAITNLRKSPLATRAMTTQPTLQMLVPSKRMCVPWGGSGVDMG